MIYILEARQRVHKGGFRRAINSSNRKILRFRKKEVPKHGRKPKKNFNLKKSGMALVFGFPTYRPCR